MVLAVLAVGFFTWLGVSAVWWALILICMGLVLAAELMNSALEGLIDHLHPTEHAAVGRVKDMLAGMVLVLAVMALGVACLAVFASVGKTIW